MLIDLKKIECYLRSGGELKLDEHGWHIVAKKGFKLGKWLKVESLRVPAPLVALLGAQGHIVIEQHLVGSAHWIGKPQQTA